MPKKNALSAYVLMILLGFSAMADANDTGKAKQSFDNNSKDTAHLDLTTQAKQEARLQKAIGLIITHGSISNDLQNNVSSPNEYVKALSSALAQANITLLPYYIYEPELPTDHMSLSFTNGYTSQGPMTIEESKSEMKSVVSEYRRYNELFSRAQSIPNE